jgi:hypothetical protein
MGRCTTLNTTDTEAALLDVTAGTVTASKALVVDSNKDLSSLRALTLTQFNYTPVSVTATDTGATTGTVGDAGMLQHVTVDCDSDANHIVILPAPVVGKIVILAFGSTGCELRSSAPATVAINGGTGANAESAIGASTLVFAICETVTSWKALQMGSDGTLAKVEAAG